MTIFLFIIFESMLIPYKFSVSSVKMITILNHNFKYFYVILYNKLQLLFTHHVHYSPFICGKGLLKF